MIKINISDDTIKILEKEHKEWYMEKIHPNVQASVEKLEKYLQYFSDKKYKSIREYIKLLKFIEAKKDSFIIEKDYKIGLEKEELIFHMSNIKRPSSQRKSILENNLLRLEKDLIKIGKIIKEKEDFKDKYSPYNIFGYDNLKDGLDSSWGRHKILRLMGVNVCPYCQRNYISPYEDEKKMKNKTKQLNKTTADLDHFIPKSIVPFLALSLYNFIPSCQICNSRMKLDKPTIDLLTFESIVINPLTESFDDYGVKFRLKDKSTTQLLDTKNKSLEEFKIILDNKSKDKKIQEKVQNTIDMFKLDKIYENIHSDYIIDMFEIIRNRPDSYLSSIVEIFTDKKYFDDEKLKKKMLDNLKEIVLEPYKFKVEKGEPLGKLTKDILEEFGIDI